MAIAFLYGRTLFVVLDQENLARVQAFDPFELTPRQTVELGPLPLPLDLVIAYAHSDEYERFKEMSPEELVKHLNRGYTFTDTDEQRLAGSAKPLWTAKRKKP